LPLGVIKIGRYGDDCLSDRRVKEALSISLELAQDESGNFRRGKGLVPKLDADDFPSFQIVRKMEREQLQFLLNVFNPAPHQPFDRINRPFRSLDQIFPCRISNNDPIFLVEGHNRRHKIQSIFSRNHDRAFPLHERHKGVRGSEIDTDNAVVSHGAIGDF